MSDAPQFAWMLTEGPVPGLFFFVVACAGLLVSWRSLASRGSLAFRPSGLSLWRLVLPPLLMFAFLGMSDAVDRTGSVGLLYAFAGVVWSVFITVLWTLYDALRHGLRAAAGVEIATPWRSVNATVAFLVGGRLMVITALLLAPLGLVATFHLVIAFAYVWAARRMALLDVSPPAETWRGLATGNGSARLGAIVILVLALAVGCLVYFNGYGWLTSWDNHTHWLTFPQEMLRNDAIFSAYDVSRSVAPDYAPQQTLDFAFLLSLWGDANAAETVVNFYNPLLIFLAGWLVFDTIRAVGNTGLAIAALLCAAVMVVYLPVVYRASGYADMRAALVLVLLPVVMSICGDRLDRSEAMRLAVVFSCVFTLKPYLIAMAFILPPVLWLRRDWRAWTLPAAAVLAVLCLIEVVGYRVLAPESLLIADSIEVSRFAELNFGNVRAGIAASRNGGTLLVTAYGLAVFAAIAALAWRGRMALSNGLVVAALMLAGLPSLLMVALLNNPAFGMSLDRYMLNLCMLGVLVVAVGVCWLAGRSRWMSVGTTALSGGLVVASAVAWMPASPTWEGLEWIAERTDELEAFPAQRVADLDFVETLRDLSDGTARPQGVLIDPYENLVDQYYYNYAFARSMPGVFSPTRTEGRGPIEPVLSMNSSAEIGAWLAENDIEFVYLRAPTELLGRVVEPGVYTRDAFLERFPD